MYRIAAAACGLALSLGIFDYAAAPWSPVLPPAMEATPPKSAAASTALTEEDEAASDEVVRLICAYEPGLRQLRSISGDFQWIISKAQDSVYLVTLQPYGDSLEDAPIYEFEVDVAAKSVTPSAETARTLSASVAVPAASRRS